jgi:hypothetical protein
MRSLTTSILAATILASAATAAVASDSAFGNAIVPIRVSTDAGDVRGTAVVVARQDRGGVVVLDLLTSADPFQTGVGGCEVRPVWVQLADGGLIAVEPDDVRLPRGTVIDIALLRISVPAARVTPEPIDFRTPAIGEVFLVAGFDARGEPKSVAQHVRFESTLLIVGDRDLATLDGCVGAPAISPAGVLGIVRACAAGRAPTISLLAPAKAFIERELPPAAQAAAAPQFQVVDREVRGPLLPIVNGIPTTAEVDVPFGLGLREAIVDATASVDVPRELRLADIRVLGLDDRSVRVRFTIGGGERLDSPAIPPQYGQALVTVHLRVAVLCTP